MSTEPTPPEARAHEFVGGFEALARHLGVSEKTARNYVAKGYFRIYLRGRDPWFDLVEVDASMRRVPTTVARPAYGRYGPKARVVMLAEAMAPEGSQ